MIKNNFLAKHCYVVCQFRKTQLPVLGEMILGKGTRNPGNFV